MELLRGLNFLPSAYIAAEAGAVTPKNFERSQASSNITILELNNCVLIVEQKLKSLGNGREPYDFSPIGLLYCLSQTPAL